MFDFPWWVGLLVVLLAFVYYVDIGAIVGSVFTYAMLSRSVRKGNDAY